MKARRPLLTRLETLGYRALSRAQWTATARTKSDARVFAADCSAACEAVTEVADLAGDLHRSNASAPNDEILAALKEIANAASSAISECHYALRADMRSSMRECGKRAVAACDRICVAVHSLERARQRAAA